jgi:hypothetical protein
MVNVLPHYDHADLGAEFAADAFAVFLKHGELHIADPVPSLGYSLDAGWGNWTGANGPELTELPPGLWSSTTAGGRRRTSTQRRLDNEGPVNGRLTTSSRQGAPRPADPFTSAERL